LRVQWQTIVHPGDTYAVALYRAGALVRVLCSYSGQGLQGTTTSCAASIAAGRYTVQIEDESRGATIAPARALTVVRRLTLLRTWLSSTVLVRPHGRLRIGYGTSVRARVTIVIETRRGRVVRLLHPRFTAAGRHSVRFSGRSASGRLLRAGRYRLHVVATGLGQTVHGRWRVFRIR
jgi:hypothetical protein